MSRARQTLLILVFSGALLALWTMLSRALPEPQLAESNFQANRLRLERWQLEATPSSVIVGTSISGRLLPAYFTGTSLASMANLGLDGASPSTALELVLRKAVVPQRVFLEIHKLDRPPDGNDELLLETAFGPSTTVARLLPVTRAASRPSTRLYAWLKERGTGGGTPPTVAGDSRTFSTNAQWLAPLQTQIGTLRTRGCEVILVRLPVGRENPTDAIAPNFADALASHLGVRLIDLNRVSAQRRLPVAYTDGFHLSPGSARELAVVLAQLAVSDQGSP